MPVIEFYVSEDGNDGWSGRLSEPNETKTDGPFASLQRARNAVRYLECRQVNGELRNPVFIYIRKGIYFLNEPLKLTPEDSGTEKCPVIYTAYKDEKPVISGGRKITNWYKKQTSASGYQIWASELPDVKSGKCYFRSLRVGNKQAIRSRYPKFDQNNPTTGGWLFASKSTPENTYDKIIFNPEDFPNWQDWEGTEVHIFPAWGWVNTIMKINGVDRENHTIYVNCKQDIRPGNRFFIANVRESLDTPGEWCLDAKSGELLYIPDDEDFPNTEIIAPATDKLIIFQSEKGKFVENIHFKNLTFSDADYNLDEYYTPADSAITLSGTRKCTIENCTFKNLSGYAVRIENKSHENEIIRNTMEGLGQGGVILLGNAEDQPFNNLIAGNDICDCGKIYKHVAGIYVTTGSGNRVIHNRITRMPRYGISFKSYDERSYSHNNIAEFNEIIDTNLETNDTGAIETLGRDMKPSGNIIRYNLIRNVVGLGTTPDGKIITPYFTWGIYLDDYSSGTLVYGNIVDSTVIGAVCIHGGKDNIIENNIFMNGIERQITLQPRDDFMTGNVFRYNIVVYENPKSVLWYSWQNTWRRDRLSVCDNNIYWHTGGIDIAKIQEKITPEGNFNAWISAGFDRNSIVSDPMLKDFHPVSDSPAFKVGFKNIPIENIGLKGFKIEKDKHL